MFAEELSHMQKTPDNGREEKTTTDEPGNVVGHKFKNQFYALAVNNLKRK